MPHLPFCNERGSLGLVVMFYHGRPAMIERHMMSIVNALLIMFIFTFDVPFPLCSLQRSTNKNINFSIHRLSRSKAVWTFIKVPL
jgi:hypothetical protein